MKKPVNKILLLLLQVSSFNFAMAQSNSLDNSFWPSSTPEEQGLSSRALNSMFDYVVQNKTRVHSIQIIRHGHLVMDAYFYPYNGQSKHDIASVTKSITSTLLGVAIDKNYISSIKSNALQYFPDYVIRDTLKNTITLEDLVTMRSGLDCGTNLSDPQINVDKRLAEFRKCDDWIKCILNIPMLSKPGERFAYCNANCHLLSAVLNKVTGMSLQDFAKKELFDPLGIKDFYWPADPKGINYGWSDLQLYPYDMLKIGELMLHHGERNRTSIVSQNWLQNATQTHVTKTGGNDKYGYYWWVPGGDYPDVFEAVGRGGQRITVWPSKDMIIVFTGGGFNTSDLIPFIVKAIQSDDAIPPDPSATKQLKANIENSLKAPVATLIKKLPKTASVVSGKNYILQKNSLNISSLEISFNNSAEATMNMIWEGENVKCNIGLDGKERFTFNPLVRLPQASTAKWIDDNTLSIKLDLVGAINFYSIKFNFIEKGKKVIIDLSEGSGLNNERIIGEQKEKF